MYLDKRQINFIISILVKYFEDKDIRIIIRFLSFMSDREGASKNQKSAGFNRTDD